MSTTSVSQRQLLGVEQLLRPVLAIVSKAGPIPVRDIFGEIARQHLLAVSRPEIENILSEAGQIVVNATIALKESGLIESAGPAVWRVTPGGVRQLQKEVAITFDVLERRPQYREYLQRLAAEKRRRDWQELRFDYYVAGRILVLQGSAYAASTALAYALEYSFKAALTELRDGAVKRSILGGHDFLNLYQTCLDHCLLHETYISDDFLEFAQHHFERRYPSGQSKLLSERRHWTFGASFLPTFDDCMIQLECGLDNIYGSSEWSLGNRALTVPAEKLALSFFHNNVFAVARLNTYRDSVQPDQVAYPKPEHLERPDLLFAASEQLPHPRVTYQKAREFLNLDLAALFVYPDDRKPDPDPVWTFSQSRTSLPGDPYSYEWILKRLREEFGPAAVEVVEDHASHSIVIFVYDRGAKQYWAALEVIRNSLPLYIRNELSRRFLERWIEKTREMFVSDRRELRLPPA